MNIKYCCLSGPDEHPIRQMIKMGITCRKAEPHTIGDCWFFFDCVGVPEELPNYMTEMGESIKPLSERGSS